MFKIDPIKDFAKIVLGFLISHFLANISIAVSGNLPAPIPGMPSWLPTFTMQLNYLAIGGGVIVIGVLFYLLFLRKKEAVTIKDFTKILMGASGIGILYGFANTDWLLLGTSIVAIATLGLISFWSVSKIVTK